MKTRHDFTSDEMDALAELLGHAEDDGHAPSGGRNGRRSYGRTPYGGSRRLPPRNLRTGQFEKVHDRDPLGNALPPGVRWYDGVDPGYEISVRFWGRKIQLTLPCREYPGMDGIHRAIRLKQLLVAIRETVPPEYFYRFACGLYRLACGVKRDMRHQSIPMRRQRTPRRGRRRQHGDTFR